MALLTLAFELSSSGEFRLSAPLLPSPSMSQSAVLATGHLRQGGRRGRPVPAPTLTAPPRRLHCGIHPATVFAPERCCDFSGWHSRGRSFHRGSAGRPRRRDQYPGFFLAADMRTTRRELKTSGSSSTCESVRVGGCEKAGWALVVSCVGGHDGGPAYARRRLRA